ncbi:hypothetical protein NP493_685g01037 [Ridgeia piscesae]|uniref:Uncharacterized protein n=1 Tax=Ridgeia piscesae TaxID=27915 RepID=A0AAD9KRJ2_RIDPI|nr:hypothetical protein NP493_685g01037 [Ridgeia piscesae]
MKSNPWFYIFCFVAFITLFGHIANSYTAATYYDYARYPYKKKQRNERKIRALKSQCEEGCENKVGLDQLSCVRRCMSRECYDELYTHDPLEEGEIDVRFNSFKGCILKKVL